MARHGQEQRWHCQAKERKDTARQGDAKAKRSDDLHWQSDDLHWQSFDMNREGGVKKSNGDA